MSAVILGAETAKARFAKGAAVSTPDDHARRTQHRPTNLEAARTAARQMILDGHSHHAIAAALGIAVEQVPILVGKFGADCE
jgi:hypothetical protein